ncbi:MAG: DUF3810 domain-containing protein [Oscillospiraceae bacterium]|nr:DUF3810 domain-containing protein [Oscillospiraceae bacterium]
MKNTALKKRGPAAIFALCPGAHVLALLGALGVGAHLALRKNAAQMRLLSAEFVQPVHRALARGTAKLPFSLAEFLYALFIGGTLVYVVTELVRLICRDGRGKRLYRLLMRLLALGLAVYALFCALWGTYYYGDDFVEKSGLAMEEISAEDLELVTLYFAARVNDFAPRVPRDGEGCCASDRAALLARSQTLFRAVTEDFPCLAGPEVPAKRMFFSRIMSIIDFTGFFCPFTGEANVNADFPVGFFASTVAHELSHQRGVAKEQEANFVAVLSSLEAGDAEYGYSACLLAFVHLANALASVKPEAVRMIYAGLDAGVMADLQANDDYWARFESPVQTVTDAVYEGFLQSYDQKLGMRSYGACVDLLVNYYCPAAAAYFHAETA